MLTAVTYIGFDIVFHDRPFANVIVAPVSPDKSLHHVAIFVNVDNASDVDCDNENDKGHVAEAGTSISTTDLRL